MPITNIPANIFEPATDYPIGETPKEQIEKFEREESEITNSLAERDRASHRALIKQAVQELWSESDRLRRQGTSIAEICSTIRSQIHENRRLIDEQKSHWQELHGQRAIEKKGREGLGEKIVRSVAEPFKYHPIPSPVSEKKMAPPQEKSEIAFPDKQPLKKCLQDHSLLKNQYYQEKGITEAVSELAGERFANSERAEQGVTVGSMLVINDLYYGEDGFTGKPLKKLDVPERVALNLNMELDAALTDCAKK